MTWQELNETDTSSRLRVQLIDKSGDSGRGWKWRRNREGKQRGKGRLNKVLIDWVMQTDRKMSVTQKIRFGESFWRMFFLLSPKGKYWCFQWTMQTRLMAETKTNWEIYLFLFIFVNITHVYMYLCMEDEKKSQIDWNNFRWIHLEILTC